MELNLLNENATSQNTISVADEVFACDYNEALVHQVITAYQANARAGTKAQKTRAEVRGGGAKPWRQKGTGRARAGTIRSPIWKGGGRAFAAKPRSFEQKVNKKMHRAAMRSILSELCRLDRLIVIEQFTLEQPSTKLFKNKLNTLGVDNALILLDTSNDNVYLSARNIPYIDVRDAEGVDPLSLVAYAKVIVTPQVLKYFEEWLQ